MQKSFKKMKVLALTGKFHYNHIMGGGVKSSEMKCYSKIIANNVKPYNRGKKSSQVFNYFFEKKGVKYNKRIYI